MIRFTGKGGGIVSIGTGGVSIDGKKLDIKPGEKVDITGPGLEVKGLQVITDDPMPKEN